MKTYKISMLFILVMIFSVGFVFAEDANHADAKLEMTDSNIIADDVASVDEFKTYTDLFNDTNQETNLSSDYEFNTENDKDLKTITVGNTNNSSTITINGNNHTIDGRNEAGAFKFIKTNATINDLIIKNCGLNAIIAENGSTVTLKNVQFINNDTDGVAAVWCANSTVNMHNCLFENSNASRGGAIFSNQSYLYVNETAFVNNKTLNEPLVYAINSIVEIERSLFTNTTFENALFTQGSKVVIVNSKFENDTQSNAYYNPNQIAINSTFEGATVTISRYGENISSTTVAEGKAVFKTQLDAGSYTLTTSFNDTEIVNDFEILSTIISLKEYKVTYNSKYPILFKFMDSEGNPLVNAPITGFVRGERANMGVTNENGELTVYPRDFNLKIGTYKIAVINNLTGEDDYSIVKVTSRFSGARNIEMYYFDGTAFKVRVYDDATSPMKKGAKVVFNINNKKYAGYTDAKGYVSFKIPDAITPGNYKITVSFAGQSITNTVKVKQVLDSKKTVAVKHSAKTLVLKATLKNGKTALKNKKITLTINGKKFNAKTDKKGIAQFTVKQDVIKKLQIGKKYAMKFTYLKNTIKTTLNVKY